MPARLSRPRPRRCRHRTSPSSHLAASDRRIRPQDTQSLGRSRSLWQFTKRRALRIYPALACVTLLTMLVLGPLLTPLPQATYWTHPQTWSYLWNATAWSVAYPLPLVFAGNPLPHVVNGSLWTLPYEVRCYLVLGLASLLPGRMLTKLSVAVVALSAMWLLRGAQSGLGSFDTWWGLDHYHVHLGLMFAIGGLYACLDERFVSSAPATCAAFAAGAMLLPPGAWQSLAGTMAFATGVLWLALRARWLPALPPRMGDWSYGVYLYAFPVQQWLASTGLHQASFAVYLGASTAITFALAALSWQLIEKQALRFK